MKPTFFLMKVLRLSTNMLTVFHIIINSMKTRILITDERIHADASAKQLQRHHNSDGGARPRRPRLV